MRRYVLASLFYMTSSVLCAGSAHASGPFLTPPGVAERAIGGAAVAGPGSVASVWYNPATLVDVDTRAAVELSMAPDRNKNGTLSAGGTSFLVGASYVNRHKWYGSAATGIAVYTPHTMKLWVRSSGQSNSAFGRVNLTSQVVGVPYAVNIDELGLSLGAVAETVTMDPSGTDLRVQNPDGSVSEAKVGTKAQTGFSGAIGARYHLMKAKRDRVDLGGMLRFKATAGARVSVTPGSAALLVPGKPGGFDFGARWRHQLDTKRSMSAYAQLSSTDWGASGSVLSESFGASLRTAYSDWGPFVAGHKVYRLGVSVFNSNPAKDWMDWPDGSMLSGGMSLDFNNGSSVDFVLQRRHETRHNYSSQSAWFLGADYGFVY